MYECMDVCKRKATASYLYFMYTSIVISVNSMDEFIYQGKETL